MLPVEALGSGVEGLGGCMLQRSSALWSHVLRLSGLVLQLGVVCQVWCTLRLQAPKIRIW